MINRTISVPAKRGGYWVGPPTRMHWAATPTGQIVNVPVMRDDEAAWVKGIGSRAAARSAALMAQNIWARYRSERPHSIAVWAWKQAKSDRSRRGRAFWWSQARLYWPAYEPMPLP